MAPIRPSKRPRAHTEDEESIYDETASSAPGKNRHKRPRPSTATEEYLSEDTASEASVQLDHDPSQDGMNYEQRRDAGFDDMRHEAADDYRATQVVTKQFKESANKENTAAENAIIEKITCINFMCHEKLEVDLGPLINFIIGHNGSGKSAVLTAITLCLGGKATATNRGQSLKSFIKEGRESATLSVKLKNHGTSAFKHDVYGDSIIVERHFSRSGTSGFRIKTLGGKLVSTKKSELEDIADAFALQLDNPMNVLTQDMARQFLSESSANQKYNFFVKGTQLETLDGDYKMFNENIDNIERGLEIKRQDGVRFKRRADEALKEAQRADSIVNMKQKETQLLHQYAWTRVHEEEQNVVQFDEAIQKADDDIQEAQTRADGASEAYERANDAVAGAESSIQTDRENVQSLQETHERIVEEFNEKKDAQQRLMAEQRSISNRVQGAKAAIQRHKKQIEEERQRQADADNGRHAQKVLELQEAKSALADLQETDKAHFSRLPKLREDLNRARTDMQGREAALSGKRQEVQDAQNLINTLSKSRNDWVQLYSQRIRNFSALWKKMQAETRFRERPIGPMGRHVKLTRPDWSSILERAFGGALDAFVVTSVSDKNILADLMRQVDCHASIFVGSARPIDTSSNEPDPALTTWMRVIKVDNDLVRNQLIINQSIDQVVLMDSREAAYQFMTGRPRTVRMCFAKRDGDARVGHVISISGGGSISVGSAAGWGAQSPRMQTDTESQIASERRNLERLQAQLSEARALLEESKNRIQQCESAVSSHARQTKTLNLDLQKAQERIDALQDEIDADTNSVGALEAMENELKAAEEEKDFVQNQFYDAAEAREKGSETLKQTTRRRAEASANLQTAQAALDAAVEGLNVLNHERTRALRNKNTALEKVAEWQTEKTKLQENRLAQLEEVANLEREAVQVCPRIEIRNGVTSERLEKEYKRMKHNREYRETQLGGSHVELWNRAHETKRKYEEAKGELNELDRLTQTLKQSMMNRHDRWRKFRRHISARARITFGYLLSERQFRGHLEISHREKFLDIQVEPDFTKVSDSGRQAKTLSGGEKSFSTICLLLALWDAMGSPIRCLDEFDVFMDNVNRDISMKMMIGAARRSVGRQYILITPQAMGNVRLQTDVKIIKMRDPERGQTTLPYGN